MFFVWLFLFVSVGFMVIVMRERRNLWFGLWITIWLGSFYVAILSLLLMIGEGPEWAYILGLILVMGPAVLIILLPIILIFLLLYNGVKVVAIRRKLSRTWTCFFIRNWHYFLLFYLSVCGEWFTFAICRRFLFPCVALYYVCALYFLFLLHGEYREFH